MSFLHMRRASEGKVSSASDKDDRSSPELASSSWSFEPQVSQRALQFLGSVPFVLYGLVDSQGCPWCHIAPAGVLLDGTLVRLPFVSVKVGSPVAILGIELPSRRRVRLDGHAESSTDYLTVNVERSFGNFHRSSSSPSPRFDQLQSIETMSSTSSDSQEDFRSIYRTTSLTEEHFRLIHSSDTFFITTARSANPELSYPNSSTPCVDVAHRGGFRGFVTVTDGGAIIWPEFQGTDFSLTSTHISLYAKCGLLFIDFQMGNMLQVSGDVSVVWGAKDDNKQRHFKCWPSSVIWSVNVLPQLPSRVVNDLTTEMGKMNTSYKQRLSRVMSSPAHGHLIKDRNRSISQKSSGSSCSTPTQEPTSVLYIRRLFIESVLFQHPLSRDETPDD